MSTKAAPVVINVNRNKLTMCSVSSSGLMTLDLGVEVIADLEVVNQEKLNGQVAEFVKNSGVGVGELLIVLGADVCFEKDVERTPSVQIALEAQKFLDTVPISSVSSKVFETDKLYRIIAISRNLYEGLRQAFEKAGFAVRMVVPSFVMGAMGMGETFDEKACRLLINHLEQVEAYGFELEVKKEDTFAQQKDKFLNKYKIVIVVLTVLSLIMLVVVASIVLKKPGA